MRAIRLPDGQRIWGVSRAESAALYHEIFELGVYSNGGIKLEDGSCVVDVGANIGMFGMYVAQQARAVRLFAFEPIPALFAILERNARDYMPGVQARLSNFALGDRQEMCAFVVDPLMSFTSTSRADEVEAAIDRTADGRLWAKALVSDMAMAGTLSRRTSRAVARAFDARLTQPLAPAVATLILKAASVPRMLSRPVWCESRPLSAVARELGIERIDLLKIDVEGGELSVLEGIAEDDWGRIQQAVVEVHDVNGRLAKIRTMFEQHGFQTSADSSGYALQRLMGISTVCAIRS
jgi:phthiocerol/phenolphthiocerol synthesis type-I polyketide synthase E